MFKSSIKKVFGVDPYIGHFMIQRQAIKPFNEFNALPLLAVVIFVTAEMAAMTDVFFGPVLKNRHVAMTCDHITNVSESTGNPEKGIIGFQPRTIFHTL